MIQHIQAPTLFLTIGKQIWTPGGCCLHSWHITHSFPPLGLHCYHFPPEVPSPIPFPIPNPSSHHRSRWLLLLQILPRLLSSLTLDPMCSALVGSDSCTGLRAGSGHLSWCPHSAKSRPSMLADWLVSRLISWWDKQDTRETFLHGAKGRRWRGQIRGGKPELVNLSFSSMRKSTFFKPFPENLCFKSTWRWVFFWHL